MIRRSTTLFAVDLPPSTSLTTKAKDSASVEKERMVFGGVGVRACAHRDTYRDNSVLVNA
jgi:hypothetical protein